MVTFAARRFREFFACGLLAVVGLYLISALSVLFKSRDDSFLGFADRAALVSHTFMHPVLVFSLAAAVVLVVVWGESPHARPIVLVAIGLGGIALIFGLVSWLAGLTADEPDGLPAYGGVVGAGKVVGVFLGLAQITFLGLVVFFAATVFASLPRTVRLTQEQWGQLYGTPPGWQPNDQWASQPPGSAEWQQPGQGGWAPPTPQQGWAPAPTEGFTTEPAAAPEPTDVDDRTARAATYEVGEPAEPAPAEPVPAAEPGAHLGVEPEADDDLAAVEEEPQAADETSTDGHDTSGWWRPSSS